MYFWLSPNFANSGQVQLPGPKKTVVGESIEVVEKWRPLAIWSTDIEEEVTMMIMIVYNITRWHISTIYIDNINNLLFNIHTQTLHTSPAMHSAQPKKVLTFFSAKRGRRRHGLLQNYLM